MFNTPIPDTVEITANLQVYPSNIKEYPAGTVVTCADMHGNVLLFLHHLIENGIITLDLKDLEKAKNLYNKKWENAATNGTVTEEEGKRAMKDFAEILANIKPGRNKVGLRLLGDLVADRGNNDVMILQIIKRIEELEIPVEITISNHDIFLLAVINLSIDQWENKLDDTDLGQPMSIYIKGLKNLIDKKIVSKEEVEKLIEETYLPHLKLLSYALTNDDKIELFTHAAAQFNSIKDLAKQLNVTYKDKTAKELAETIDEINSSFQKLCCQNPKSQLYQNMIDSALKQYVATPLGDLVWRYNDKSHYFMEGGPKDSVEETYPPYVKYVVHGHCGQNYWARSPRDVNLDADVGKVNTSQYAKGTYLIFTDQESLKNINIKQKQKIIKTPEPIKADQIAKPIQQDIVVGTPSIAYRKIFGYWASNIKATTRGITDNIAMISAVLPKNEPKMGILQGALVKIELTANEAKAIDAQLLKSITKLVAKNAETDQVDWKNPKAHKAELEAIITKTAEEVFNNLIITGLPTIDLSRSVKDEKTRQEHASILAAEKYIKIQTVASLTKALQSEGTIYTLYSNAVQLKNALIDQHDFKPERPY